jgi:hypothetical protein
MSYSKPCATHCDRRAVLIVAALLLAACPALDPKQGLQATPAAQLYDYNGFVCEAMPVLIRHCSYLGCHGQANHAFRVYSSGKLRLGDVSSRSDRDAPLSADEVQGNFDSATGMLLAGAAPEGQPLDQEKAPLVLKPLRAAFGGDEHHGVGIFPFPPAASLAADPEWTALTQWAAGAKEPSPPTANCKNLFSALGLTPK